MINPNVHSVTAMRRHDGATSFVGETLQKAVTAAQAAYGVRPAVLLVLLPDTGAYPVPYDLHTLQYVLT